MRVLSIIILLSMQSGIQAQTDLISIRKGACFGQCPVYKLTVTSEGLLSFRGIRYVPEEGTFERQLSKKEFRKLKRKLRKSKFTKLDSEYGMNVTDLAKTTIIYSKEDHTEKVVYKMDPPKKLLNAEKYLISLSPLENTASAWTKIAQSPKPKIDRPSPQTGRKEIGQETIIVQLKPSVDLDEWLMKYKEFGLKLNKKLVPNRPLYLLRHDPKTIPMTDLIKRMKLDSEVDEVEKNKKAKMR